MAYTIKLTNSAIELVRIEDGTSDIDHSSITLFGKNYAGYGPLLNENLIYMLENFSFQTPPANPLEGQLWWNSNSKLLHVFKDSGWKVIGAPLASATEPTDANIGDLWWDSSVDQLKACNSNLGGNLTWTTVGPTYNKTQGLNGPVAKTINDTLGNPHTVVEMFVNDQLISIISKDPAFTIPPVDGFSIIKPGFNLPAPNNQYSGNAENALSLGGVLAANYLRSDVNDVTTGSLSIQTNTGLNVGLNNDLTVNVNGNAVNLNGNVLNRDLDFYVNVSGFTMRALHISGSNGLITVMADPVAPLGIATKQYVDTQLANEATTLLHADGSVAIVGNLSPQITNTYSLGTASNNFETVYSNMFSGISVSAQSGSFNSVTIANNPATPNSAATKQYVDNTATTLTNNAIALNQTTINTILSNVPSSLSNLAAIANAISNNPNFSTDNYAALSLKATIESPTLTGTPRAPTPAASDFSTTIPTTAFVGTAITNEHNIIMGTLGYYATTANLNTAISSLSANAFSADSGITTSGNNAVDIGSPAHRFRTVYAATFSGTAMSANYADLAENYVSDKNYEAGTVLEFGGSREVTFSETQSSNRVAGVVSTKPAYLMNDACEGEFVVAIALQGRCPVKVVGPIRKGDLLVSAGFGRAKSNTSPQVGTVLGKALQDFNGELGIIEVAISKC